MLENCIFNLRKVGYTPLVSKFNLFIDDGGSRELGLIGYTTLVIDVVTANDLSREIARVKESHGVESLPVALI